MLRKAGHLVTGAGSNGDALQQISAQSFDLFLLGGNEEDRERVTGERNNDDQASLPGKNLHPDIVISSVVDTGFSTQTAMRCPQSRALRLCARRFEC